MTFHAATFVIRNPLWFTIRLADQANQWSHNSIPPRYNVGVFSRNVLSTTVPHTTCTSSGWNTTPCVQHRLWCRGCCVRQPSLSYYLYPWDMKLASRLQPAHTTRPVAVESILLQVGCCARHLRLRRTLTEIHASICSCNVELYASQRPIVALKFGFCEPRVMG
jgi:hypothetical protein